MKLFLLWAVWLTATPLFAEQVVTDDLGNVIHLAAPPQRIVSLTPHITELLYAVGAGDRLVAAVDYSDYPAAAKSLPRIGNAERIDHERLLQVRPDLIIAWGSGTPARELDSLRHLGVPMYLSEPRRLDAIGAQLRVFGEIAGTSAQAEIAAQEYEHRLTELRARYAANPQRTVFYQLAQQPLLTVNREHLINDVLMLCGGVNLFADVPALTPRVDIEAVLAARPEAVVFALYPGESVHPSCDAAHVGRCGTDLCGVALRNLLSNSCSVIPAQTGIQGFTTDEGSGSRHSPG
ncbi:MAG: cobalamin-binding protein [Gammaproteobacteria bacterium]|nr:cobalamin-binding protein [Gammaproteobacteria bacterium]